MKNTPQCPCCCQIIPDVVFKQLKKDGIDIANDSRKDKAEDFRTKRNSFMSLTRSLLQSNGKAEIVVFNSKNTSKMKVTQVRKEGEAPSTDADALLSSFSSISFACAHPLT